MANTIRTEAQLLEIFKDAQAAGSITAQDARDLIVSVSGNGGLLPIAAAQLQSQVTQVVSVIDTPTAITLEVENFKEGITHSTVTESEIFTVTQAGIYEISVGVSLLQTGGGTGQVTVWVEEATSGSPTTWTQTADAVRRDTGKINTAGFASVSHMDRHIVGDKFRVMWSTTTVDAELTAFVAGSPVVGAGVPAVPSVDVHIKRISS